MFSSKRWKTNHVLPRKKFDGLEVFKCSPSFITDMFRICATPCNTRGGIKLLKPKISLKIWNELPTSMKNTKHMSEFKCSMNEWPGPICKCGSCKLCKFDKNDCFATTRWLYMPVCLYHREYANISMILYICICVYIHVYMCIPVLCICMCVCMHIDALIVIRVSLLSLLYVGISSS